MLTQAPSDGVVHVGSANGIGVLAVGTINIGASAILTVTADTGGIPLPVTLTVCQTNPATGQCISPIGPSVVTTINSGATPSFAVFAAAAGQIASAPNSNRVFVRFTDAFGAPRGAISVAIQTQ